MRLFLICALSLPLLALSGCSKPVAKTPAPPAATPPAPAAPTEVTLNSPVDIRGLNTKEDWEKAEKIFKEFEGVQGIVLAAQQEDGKIDKPLAYMKYSEKIDRAGLAAKLKEAGFEISIQQR